LTDLNVLVHYVCCSPYDTHADRYTNKQTHRQTAQKTQPPSTKLAEILTRSSIECDILLTWNNIRTLWTTNTQQKCAVQLCDFVFPLINEQLVKLAKW